MESLSSLLKQIHSPENLTSALKILNQVTIPKLNNEIILLLRNVVRINNQVIQQFDGLTLVIKIMVKSLNFEYTSAEWSSIGENFINLVIAIFDSFIIYRNTSFMKDIKFYTLILEAGKSILPIVDKVDCLRVSVNNNGYSSILQLICLDNLDFLVQKEIFLLFKPIIVKSDTRQRKNIMNSNELFLSGMAAMVLKCGDFETQEAIVEVLMRFSYSSKRKLNKILFWFREYPGVLLATRLLDYKSFDISCRKFLNSVNGHMDSNVVTLSCFEAYANEIKLEKPRSKEYEELWVDFSLKTGIIHIVCDSGANAWLRLFIDHKNVRNSFFSSRPVKKDESEVKGKQILLELISPLEIELHFKESLIVTITLIFVESPMLDNLQTNFFNKWYHHLNKREKNNQFMAVSKAFQENIHHRGKQKDKFFNGTSISSLSSIHSCSTCSFRPCCHNKGKVRSPPHLNYSPRDFLTSTPKGRTKCQQDHSPHTKFARPCGTLNFCPRPSKHVNQNSASISGGIFNHGTLQKFQDAIAKSSLVKGISISDDKKEDDLFKKMIEESVKKEKDQKIDISQQDVGNVPVFSAKVQTPLASGANFGHNNLPKSTHKPLKLGILKNVAAEQDISKKIKITDSDKINNNDFSEESEFIMASHGNKQNMSNENKEPIEISNSSSSQIGSSDEKSTKSSHKGINLFNPEENKITSFQSFEKMANPENNPKTDFHGNIWNDNAPAIKKTVPYSPYFKLFNLNNSSTSIQSGQIQQDHVTANPGKNTSQNKESSNSVFKLKPSALNFNSLSSNEKIPMPHSSFLFSSNEEVNTFSKLKKDVINEQKNELDKKNSGFGDFKYRPSNMSSVSKTNRKENYATDIEKTIQERITDLKTENHDEIIVINEEEENVDNDQGDLRQSNYLNYTTIAEQTRENEQNIEKAEYINNQINKSSLVEHEKINREHFDQESPTRAPNIKSDLQQKSGPSHNILSDDEETEDENKKRKKKKSLPKKRNSKRSTGTGEAASSGLNSTISSLHCIAIPQKTYSTNPAPNRAPPTPEKTFDNLINKKKRKNIGNEISEKKPNPGRKRKLFTPNSSLEETSPLKQGEVSVLSSEMSLKDTDAKTYKRKSKVTSNLVEEQKKKKKTLECPETLANVYDFIDSSPTSFEKKKNEKKTQLRKSLRTRVKKRYKELSTDESDTFQKEPSPPKKKSAMKQKTSLTVPFTPPGEKLSISEKVSKFVWSMNENREHLDVLRQEDLESELKLSEVPVEENKSDLSQLESIEPPLWLSSSEAGVPSLLGSQDSLNATTELIKGELTTRNDEIEFLQSIIKNIECLSLSVKRRNPKINSQEKIVKTIESLTNSGIEEMNKKWQETRESLQLMLTNLDNISDSYINFISSLERRMKDMIESSISDFNKDRSNSNTRSENLCKELKKMCHERHKLLKKQ